MGVRVREWKGAWWVFKTYRKQRQAVRVGVGPKAKKVADEAARQIAAKLALGDSSVFDRPARSGPEDKPEAPTFEAVAREWLTRYPALHAIRPQTLKNYSSFIEQHLIPYFGAMPVETITVDVVEAFIEAKRSPGGSTKATGKALSDSSLRTGLIPLRLILKRAVRRRLIQANPVNDAEWSGIRRIENVDPFTTTELRAILTAADRLAVEQRIRQDFPAMLRVWAQTGMRAGEVAGLQWQDVDFTAGTVMVRRTFSGHRLGPTKTGQARTVSLLHPVAEATSDWRPGSTESSRGVLTALRRLTVRSLKQEAFIFGDRAPLSSNAVHLLWRRVLSAAGVRYRAPEQFRHTFASTLLSRNAPLLYVQQAGGWRSAAVLLRVYARWIPTAAGLGSAAGPEVSVQPDATASNRSSRERA